MQSRIKKMLFSDYDAMHFTVPMHRENYTNTNSVLQVLLEFFVLPPHISIFVAMLPFSQLRFS